MIALLKTAERINNTSFVNNYVFQWHVLACKAIPQYCLDYFVTAVKED